MKKVFCLMYCLLLIFGTTACAAAQNQNDRSARPVKLTYPSAPESAVSEDESSQAADVSELSDPAKDFEIIPKLEQLPDFMQNNPSLYADMLEKILKIYYSGLVSGRINSTTYHQRFNADRLPSAKATPEQRIKIAELCTVGGALEYFGMDQKNYMKYMEMYNGSLPYFCYDRDASVFAEGSVSSDKVLKMTGFSQSLYFLFRYANNDQTERDAMQYAADNIDSFVKSYYQGIQNGSINTSSFRPVYTSDPLPKKNASEKDRQTAADQATIAGALDYAGYYTVYVSFITKLGYHKNASIFTLPDFTNPDIIAISSENTRISQLRQR